MVSINSSNMFGRVHRRGTWRRVCSRKRVLVATRKYKGAPSPPPPSAFYLLGCTFSPPESKWFVPCVHLCLPSCDTLDPPGFSPPSRRRRANRHPGEPGVILEFEAFYFERYAWGANENYPDQQQTCSTTSTQDRGFKGLGCVNPSVEQLPSRLIFIPTPHHLPK